MIFSSVFLREMITWLQIAGAVLIILGVSLTRRAKISSRNREQKTEEGLHGQS
jgi:drug/metabolite transporter (DMT)-like permease